MSRWAKKFIIFACGSEIENGTKSCGDLGGNMQYGWEKRVGEGSVRILFLHCTPLPCVAWRLRAGPLGQSCSAPVLAFCDPLAGFVRTRPQFSCWRNIGEPQQLQSSTYRPYKRETAINGRKEVSRL